MKMYYMVREYRTKPEKDGSYMVFFPRDAHKTGIAEGALQNVKKVVAKVKVDGFKEKK